MAFTGNSNYAVSTYSAFAVEKAVANSWSAIWTTGFPLLKALAHKKTNFNTGFSISEKKMVIPVLGDSPTQAAAGVTDANELSAQTLSATNGFSQAAFEFAHYRHTATYRESELRLATNGKLGPFFEGKKKQILDAFSTSFSNDAAGNAVDSRSAVMGTRYALSTSNTVGGISQSTDTQWAANVKTSAGTTSLALLDEQFDNIAGFGRQDADLILASTANSVNVYGKIRALLGTSERVIDPDQFQSVGFRTFSYMGAPVILNNRGASGEALVLSTPTWYVCVPKAPTASPMVKVSGTDAMEQTFTMWAAIGIADPASNSRIAGLS